MLESVCRRIANAGDCKAATSVAFNYRKRKAALERASGIPSISPANRGWGTLAGPGIQLGRGMATCQYVNVPKLHNNGLIGC